MAFEKIRELARSAPRPMVSSSMNSRQSSEKSGQKLPIYSRQDSGRSSYELPNISVRERVRLYQQNLNTPGPVGFTRQPADFPRGVNGVQQRIAELHRNGLESGLPQANPVQPNTQSAFRNPVVANSVTAHNSFANAIQSNAMQRQIPTILQAPPMPNVSGGSSVATQRLNSPQAYQPQSNAQQGQHYQHYGPQYSSAQQGQHFSSQPFSSANNLAWHEAEVKRLMSHPGRHEFWVPHGTSFGFRMTEAGPVGYSGLGALPPGVTELSQLPVGVTSLGTWPYRS